MNSVHDCPSGSHFIVFAVGFLCVCFFFVPVRRWTKWLGRTTQTSHFLRRRARANWRKKSTASERMRNMQMNPGRPLVRSDLPGLKGHEPEVAAVPDLRIVNSASSFLFHRSRLWLHFFRTSHFFLFLFLQEQKGLSKVSGFFLEDLSYIKPRCCLAPGSYCEASSDPSVLKIAKKERYFVQFSRWMRVAAGWFMDEIFNTDACQLDVETWKFSI